MLIDILFWTGAALISVGLGLWFGLGPGLAAAGVFCLAASVLVEQGEKDDDDDNEDGEDD
jgi:4-hydroxybenzoate polyprenyltransferase